MKKPAESNVFSSQFLECTDRRDPPPLSTSAAAMAGPWIVEPKDQEFAVIRDSGGDPEAVVTYRETALLLAAVFPAVGRGPCYWLLHDDTDAEYPVALTAVLGQQGQSVVGHLRYLHEDLVAPLSTVEGLIRSPRALSFLLEAAPTETLIQSGRLLARRLGLPQQESEQEDSAP